MNRRNFFDIFESLLANKEADRASANMSLEPMEEPLSKVQALHLLRRVTFAATPEMVDILVGKKIGEALDMILGDGKDHLEENKSRLPNIGSSLNWIDTPEVDPRTLPLDLRFELEGRMRNRYNQFVNWWLKWMNNPQANQHGIATEKLTMFWHSHWCIEFVYDTEHLLPPPLLIRNNQKLRRHRLGNFPDFVEEMTLDGAFLLYQSLNFSSKEAPNENYMRELLELFTMGIGNYEEVDIVQGAKALTGWRVSSHIGIPKPFDFFDTFFNPDAHDIGKKVVLGREIPPRNVFDNTMEKVRREEVRGIINILFERRPNEIADFICRKLYRYFIYSNQSEIEDEVIEQMAKVFIDNNFELYPLFRYVFSSQHFFDSVNIGAQIKTPTEFTIGFERFLGTNYQAVSNAMSALEQTLYNPPNVSGWNDYRAWISSSTYPARVFYANSMVDTSSNETLIALANKLSNPSNLDSFIDSVLEFTLPIDVGNQRNEIYKELMWANKSGQQWTTAFNAKNQEFINAFKVLLKEIILSPDFQLC